MQILIPVLAFAIIFLIKNLGGGTITQHKLNNTYNGDNIEWRKCIKFFKLILCLACFGILMGLYEYVFNNQSIEILKTYGYLSFIIISIGIVPIYFNRNRKPKKIEIINAEFVELPTENRVKLEITKVEKCKFLNM